MTRRRVAVIGAGWAGLAAAVQLVRSGHPTTVLEMAPACGGRARSRPGDRLDNGQHILIGAYRASLALMRTVGVEPRQALLRTPLRLALADRRQLRIGGGPTPLAFARAVLACRAWTWGERLAVLEQGRTWLAKGFRMEPDTTVDVLCRGLPRAVRQLLIDPLCVSALNTPTRDASAQVFLRVLQEGLFGAPGCSDLLLPRVPLQQLLPDAARHWLLDRGAEVRTGRRVHRLEPQDRQWRVDGEGFDHVVLACSAVEAARLALPWSETWSRQAQGLAFEPIVTVYLQLDGVTLPEPMLGLADGPDAPAQFVFDRGRLDGRRGLFAFVVSGAGTWLDQGREACADAVRRQAGLQLAHLGWRDSLVRRVEVMAERRATFRCHPALDRPPTGIAPGLWAAGDYVAGPYPATLEGAVRSGLAAAQAVADSAPAFFHDAK